MKTLNVKKIAKRDIESKWGVKLPAKYPATCYIRCNAKGVVNFDKAPIYHPIELVERGNYKIIY